MIVNDRLKGKKTLNVGILEEFEKDSIKKDIDIVNLFNHFGVNLTKKGSSFTGCCPWHEDTNPSLSVDQKKGLYNCFGCGESGDAFTLVEKMKGYSFKESLAFLKEWKGSPQQTACLAGHESESAGHKQPPAKHVEGEPAEAEKESPGDGETTAPKTAPFMKKNAAEMGEIERSTYLTLAADYYHKRLLSNKQAMQYLKKRGLGDPELITRYRLGFCDATLRERAGEKKQKAFIACGIMGTPYTEHFHTCITFPITDEQNMVVGMYGRRKSERTRVKHLYLKGEHRGVFNRKASQVYDAIILTESIIDALSLIALGINNVQALYGTNGFTEEHLQILKDDRVKTVICAFDNDEGGKKAAEKISTKLVAEGFQVKVIFPPLKSSNGTDTYYKDWNEYLIGSPDESILTALIENTEVFRSEENKKDFDVTKDNLGYTFVINTISYRVSGVKEMFISNLRVNIKAEHVEEEGLKYYDNLDLYSARSRSTYSQNMSKNCDIEPNRVEKDLITILEYLEEKRDRDLFGEKDKESLSELTASEREHGMSFLTSSDMFKEIVDDMTVLGYIGEDLNKQLMYIAASSRKLSKPIPVMVLSAPASGKSYLIDTVERMLPPEDVISVTSLSEQALNYVEDMQHKFLSLGEMVHSETIEHHLRELISKQRLTRLVTQKDNQTGKMVSRQVTTEAVVSLAMSGTNHDINPENASRFFIINTDESRDQTRRIQESQWEKHSLERHFEKRDCVPGIIKKHQAAQKMLNNVNIFIPYGRHLDFPDSLMRTRRDNDRFIDLIAAVCFLRQYQKERKIIDDVEYIECDLKDYETAYDIMTNGVLSSSLLEIPKGALQLYEELRKLVRKRAKKDKIEAHEVSITQREIREGTGFGQTWLKMHLKRLVDYEYVTITRGGGARSKGYYRIREDKPIEEIDLSVIPTPERIKELMTRSGHSD